MKETKDFYLNPLNKIKWGPDERSASDFALCQYESRKTNISQTNTFKIDISIWQHFGLERTLLRELPLIWNRVTA